MGMEREPAEHEGAFARLMGKPEFQGSAGEGVPADSREGLKAARLARDKKSHGPPGANVFIFHIPNEWTSGDLLRHFSPFGPLISARIAVDRHTRRNRGFAFVNYQDVKSAIVAVGTMDGFQVGLPVVLFIVRAIITMILTCYNFITSVDASNGGVNMRWLTPSVYGAGA